jgi:hypothetical protein
MSAASSSPPASIISFYGWFFFAIVIALLMAVGWRFFDRRAGDPLVDPQKLQPVRPRSSPLIAVARRL